MARYAGHSNVVILVALTGLVPGAGVTSLAGQEGGRYAILRGADTMVVETANRDTFELRGTLTRRGGRVGERVRYRATVLEDESAPLVDFSVWRLDDPEDSPARQSVRLIFKDDSVAVDEANRWGGVITRVLPTRAGAIPYLAGSTAMLELITRRALRPDHGESAVPVFDVGGGQTGEGLVRRVAADSVVVAIGAVEYRLRVDPAGRILGGTAPAQGLRLSRVAE